MKISRVESYQECIFWHNYNVCKTLWNYPIEYQKYSSNNGKCQYIQKFQSWIVQHEQTFDLIHDLRGKLIISGCKLCKLTHSIIKSIPSYSNVASLFTSHVDMLAPASASIHFLDWGGGGGGGKSKESVKFFAKSQYKTLRALNWKLCMFSSSFMLNMIL